MRTSGVVFIDVHYTDTETLGQSNRPAIQFWKDKDLLRGDDEE
jgi:hypothetical protein